MNFSLIDSFRNVFHLKSELPQPENFEQVRERYVQRRASDISKECARHHDSEVIRQFETLSEDEKKTLSVLVSHFELGVALTHRTIGMTLKKSDFVIEPHDYYYAGPFAYVSKEVDQSLDDFKDRFLLCLDKLIEIIRNPEKMEELKKHWEIDEIFPEDLFFLIGVEEAAHRAYFNKKNRRDVLKPNDSPTYHASDSEYRALLWKLKFVKKYFPQYAEAFEAFLQKNATIRHTALNSD